MPLETTQPAQLFAEFIRLLDGIVSGYAATLADPIKAELLRSMEDFTRP